MCCLVVWKVVVYWGALRSYWRGGGEKEGETRESEAVGEGGRRGRVNRRRSRGAVESQWVGVNSRSE